MGPNIETACYKLGQHMSFDTNEEGTAFYPDTQNLLATPSPLVTNNQFGVIEAAARIQDENLFFRSPSYNSSEPQFQPKDIQELSSSNAYMCKSSGSSSDVGSPLSPQGYLTPYGYNAMAPGRSLLAQNSTENFSTESGFLCQGDSELNFLAESPGNFSPKEKIIKSVNNPFLETSPNIKSQYMRENILMLQPDPNEVKHADHTLPTTSHELKIYQPENRQCTSFASNSCPYISSASYMYPEISPIIHHDRINKLGNIDISIKTKCTYPDCGKVFKDLKAHMLTHQNERPEKCPIQTCEYHTKGFARKYDKNRHTLTHFKGTMICGFCPESKSSAKKTFNRADVFKRHLTAAHAVEQSPPNSKRKTSRSQAYDGHRKNLKQLQKSSGKCSTCFEFFSNAQDFYEHLDDCVLQTIQRQDPSEVINVARLAEVEYDEDVQDTLRINAVISKSKSYGLPIKNFSKNEFEYTRSNNLASQKQLITHKILENQRRHKRQPYSKFLALQNLKGSKRSKELPLSWTCSSQIKAKKRVLCLFNGPRRFWKDETNLDINHELEPKVESNPELFDGIDAQTMQRANSLHVAAEENPGLYLSGDTSCLFFMTSKDKKSTHSSST